MRLGPEGLKMGKVGQFCAGALAAYTNTFEKNIIKYLPIKMRRDSPAMQSKIYHALDEIRRGATHIERAMMFPGGEYRKYCSHKMTRMKLYLANTNRRFFFEGKNKSHDWRSCHTGECRFAQKLKRVVSGIRLNFSSNFMVKGCMMVMKNLTLVSMPRKIIIGAKKLARALRYIWQGKRQAIYRILPIICNDRARRALGRKAYEAGQYPRSLSTSMFGNVFGMIAQKLAH